MSDYIALLDPALMDNNGTPSYNLGDLIIHESVLKIFEELFPGTEIRRISSHIEITAKEKEILKGSRHTFVGGTNILTSNIRNFQRLTVEKRRSLYLFPGFSNVVLIGAGWAKYDGRPDIYTAIYYNRILSPRYYQSLRDTYTSKKLNSFFRGRVMHTSCPTVWKLHEYENSFKPEYSKILFTLTDYDRNPELDAGLIKILFETGSREINFFPQGTNDEDYINSLDIVKNNRGKITIMPHDFKTYIDFVDSGSFNYIGTRLHGGIRCMQRQIPALIIGIDNRALEIRNDIGLNVVERSELNVIRQWTTGEYKPGKLSIPTENIQNWKRQFSS
jgi:hypothetical protein